MEQKVASLSGKPQEDWLFSAQSDTEAYDGRLQKAREFTRLKEVAARYEAGAALREAEFGNLAEARRHAEAGLALSERKITGRQSVRPGWRYFPDAETGRSAKRRLPLRYSNSRIFASHQFEQPSNWVMAGPPELLSICRRPVLTNWEKMACFPLRFAVKPTLPPGTAKRRRPSSKSCSIIAESCTTRRRAHWRIFNLVGRMPWLAISPKRRSPIKTFSPSGKTPTPTFLS
jgi:hypothetical protein